MNEEQQLLQKWRIQPETDEQIAYDQFLGVYGFSHEQIDALISIMRHFYPGLPVQNRTLEWAVLKQRDIEAQNALAAVYEERQSGLLGAGTDDAR
jgi:hypothetical protein